MNKTDAIIVITSIIVICAIALAGIFMVVDLTLKGYDVSVVLLIVIATAAILAFIVALTMFLTS